MVPEVESSTAWNPFLTIDICRVFRSCFWVPLSKLPSLLALKLCYYPLNVDTFMTPLA